MRREIIASIVDSYMYNNINGASITKRDASDVCFIIVSPMILEVNVFESPKPYTNIEEQKYKIGIKNKSKPGQEIRDIYEWGRYIL